MKHLEVSLTPSGIERLIKETANYETWLKARTETLLRRLADEGMNVASLKFAGAVYDGTNDVSVTATKHEDGTWAVIAVGNATLFIEFGTGVTYPDNHPEAGELNMKRGQYGKGLGKRRSWYYYGEPGINGVQKQLKNGNVIVKTHGNPANMPMYETVKELEERLRSIAREVFR